MYKVLVIYRIYIIKYYIVLYTHYTHKHPPPSPHVYTILVLYSYTCACVHCAIDNNTNIKENANPTTPHLYILYLEFT